YRRYYQSYLFFHVTATSGIYPLSLHDALPIFEWNTTTSRTPASRSSSLRTTTERRCRLQTGQPAKRRSSRCTRCPGSGHLVHLRSEEHTSELQSRSDLVCRLLLEKKKHNSTRA